MKAKLLLILIFTLIISKGKAQTSNDEAVATFQLAQSEFDKGNFQGALTYLNKVDALNPEAKTKTSYLKARCYYNLILGGADDQYTNCLNSIQYYLDNGKDNDKRQELLKLKIQIEQLLEQQKKARQEQAEDQKKEVARKLQIANDAAKGAITIGDHVWSTVNLNTITFSNGDNIPQAVTDKDWFKACKNGKPAWCYYKLDPSTSKYGKMYNSFALRDSRGIAPQGWHIPSDDESESLNNILAKDSSASSAWRMNYIGNNTNEPPELLVCDCFWPTKKHCGAGFAYNDLSLNDNYYRMTNNINDEAYFVRCIKDK